MGSPTVNLVQTAQSYRSCQDSRWGKEVLSRGACFSAVAVSAVEAVGQAIATVAVTVGLIGRIIIRIINRGLAGAVGAVWGMVYGNLFSFSLSVWLGRIVINVYLFARDISIAWKHWMERTVACGDLFWVGVRLWALAGKIDQFLAVPFSQKRCLHHLSLTFSHLTFACSNSLGSFISPEDVIESCKKHDLGRSIPPPSLQKRIWFWVNKHKAMTAAGVTVAILAMDYFVSKPENMHVYLKELPKKAASATVTLLRHTLGLLYDIPLMIYHTTEYLREAVKDREITNALNLMELKKLCEETKQCPPRIQELYNSVHSAKA